MLGLAIHQRSDLPAGLFDDLAGTTALTMHR